MNHTILISALLAGCGSVGAGTTPWWDVTTGRGTDPATDEDPDATDAYDDEDEEGQLVDEKLFWGELVISQGTPQRGYAGILWTETTGVRCELEYELSLMDPAVTDPAVTECEACMWSVALQVGDAEIYEDDGSCTSEPLAALGGQIVQWGFASPDTAWWVQDGAWTAAGWAEEEDDYWFFEAELP